jgi:L-2,4-diaminobutyrate transaminase
MFGLEHWDVAPDIMTMSKGISSSYLPIGGAIVSREIADRFGSDDDHFRQALTFGGHPVAAAAALKNIEIIESEGLIQNAAETGAYFKEKLEGLMDRHQMIGDVRGIGMLVAIELVKDRDTKEYFPKELGLGKKLTEKFRRESLLLETDGQIIGFNPPLCTTRSDVDEIVGVVDMAMTEAESELSMSS